MAHIASIAVRLLSTGIILKHVPNASEMLMSDTDAARLVHTGSGEQGQRELATHVTLADTALAKSRGLMFTSGLLENHGLCMQWPDCQTRWLHMLAVPAAIDALWIDADNRVTHCKRLAPMIGLGRARAATVYELPAGAASRVEVGDRVRLLIA
jgi:Uncharacterized conserved protein